MTDVEETEVEEEAPYTLADFHREYPSSPRYRLGDRVFFDGDEDIGRIRGRAYHLDEVVYWVEFKDGTKDVYSAHQLKPILKKESNANGRSNQDSAEENSGGESGDSSEGL